jgi:hypothetical protein
MTSEMSRKESAIRFLGEELKRTVILASAQRLALEELCSHTGQRWPHLVTTFVPQVRQRIAPIVDCMLQDMLSTEATPPLQDRAWKAIIQNLVQEAFGLDPSENLQT